MVTTHAAPRRTGLSKSRITLFEQCPKRLWLSVHRPDLSEETATIRASFATGHEVGALACALLPGGYMIGADNSLTEALAETASLIASGWRQPIFEATFAHDDVLVRVDLMIPQAGGWHVAEVKSTTGVKDYHLGDLATQLWVMGHSGIEITSASIRHLDSSFVLLREGELDGVFADSFVHERTPPLVANRADVVAGARSILSGDEPAREMGAHCDAPFTCSFKLYCGRDLPPAPEWPVALLPDAIGKQRARYWSERGVNDLLELAADDMPNPKLQRIYAATLSGIAYHDRGALIAETAGWAYPRTFLDFETIQFPIPRWIGTGPYAQVPFQFSAHIVEADGRLSHRAFLSLDGSDPRRACAEALAALPAQGAVVAWNAAFERECLLKLADQFADLAPALRSLAARLVDLLPPIRRHYYHRDMRGSWSIKAVLPTVAPELAYGSLGEVQSGTDAQAGYLEAVHPDTSEKRRIVIRTALLDYCRRDTEAVMVVLDRLTALPGG